MNWIKNPDALFRSKLPASSPKEPLETKELLRKVSLPELIHRRTGHLRGKQFHRLCKHLTAKSKLPKEEIEEVLDNCDSCLKAKKPRVQNHKPRMRATRPLYRVYMDFWGPYNGQTMGEYRYILTLTDCYSRFSWVYLTKDRSLPTLLAVLEPWIRRQERVANIKLVQFRTDNAKEFKALKAHLKKKGIGVELTTPYMPEQNGVAKCLNQILLEITRMLLFNSSLPPKFWPHALKAANYI